MKNIFCPYCRQPILSNKNESEPCSFGCYLRLKWNAATQRRLTLSLVSGFGLLGAGLAYPYIQELLPFPEAAGRWVSFALAGLVVILLGAPLFRYTSSNLWHRIKPMGPEFLMSMVIIIDFAYSTMVTLFPGLNASSASSFFVPFYFIHIIILLSWITSYVESRCRRLASENIEKSHSRQAASAKKLVKGSEVSGSASELKPGDIVRIYPGEVIPCDGMIITGTTSVDESALTAEATILLKTRGERVTGGTLNRDGIVDIEVMTELTEHFLPKVLSLTREAMAHVPSLEKWLTWLIPLLFIVLLGGVVGFFSSVRSFDFQEVLMGAMTVLSLLAFGSYLRIPSMIFSLALGQTALHGILIRSPDTIRKLGKLTSLFFNKTGTITQGRLEFSKIFLEKGVNQGRLLSSIFSLEACTDHPIAQGVRTHPWYPEFRPHPVADFGEHPGLGISGKIVESGEPERFVALGSQRFLKRFQMQISKAMRIKVEELEAVGDTVALCGWEGLARGVISFVDVLRPDVGPLLKGLNGLKVETIMLTGDHEQMTGHLTQLHGLSHIYTRCIPQEKVNKIKNKQAEGGLIGMVDCDAREHSPLTAADVGILTSVGTHMLDNRVPVLILGKYLPRIADMIAYARRVQRIMTFGLSLSVMGCLVATAMLLLNLTHPLFIIMAMFAVRLILVAYPLRLLKENFVAG